MRRSIPFVDLQGRLSITVVDWIAALPVAYLGVMLNSLYLLLAGDDTSTLEDVMIFVIPAFAGGSYFVGGWMFGRTFGMRLTSALAIDMSSGDRPGWKRGLARGLIDWALWISIIILFVYLIGGTSLDGDDALQSADYALVLPAALIVFASIAGYFVIVRDAHVRPFQDRLANVAVIEHLARRR